MVGQIAGVGDWAVGVEAPAFGASEIEALLGRVREPVHVVQAKASGHVGLAVGGVVRPGDAPGEPLRLLATLPPLYPEWLGDRSFQEAHGVRFPYVTGAMANGIATPALVVAAAKAGLLGFFGAAGLSFERVEQGIDQVLAGLGGAPLAWGANLIHAPQEPGLEARTAELFVRRGVPCVEASAFMKLAPSVVRYAYSGLHVGADGQLVRPRRVMAKVSRAEVAAQFMRPAPAAMLAALVAEGHLTAEEARLGAGLPVAEDITVESDSGGHTDNRPLGALLPSIMALRDAIVSELGLGRPIRVGAAGGLGTPQAVASAFALGAAYVVTGSVNQAAVESGLSPAGRLMLAQAGVADVMMAPAADMFELGVEVQVLKRGTLFGPRGARLFEVYQRYPGVEAIPAEERRSLEQRLLGATLDQIWEETRGFWGRRDPAEVARAEADPKHRMALMFRWYLGKASRWAIEGEPSRVMDYQIWCGPAMGAFNTWVKGSFLEAPEARGVVPIALNLLEGAAVLTRAHQLRTSGLPLPPSAFRFTPRPLQG